MYEVPDIIWKGFFDVRSDLGFLSFPKTGVSWYDEYLPSSHTINWHSLCLHGRQCVAGESGIVQNRQRIWQLCLLLSNLVDEIYESERLHFDDHVDNPFLGQRPIWDSQFNIPTSSFDLGIPFVVRMIQQQDMEQDPRAYRDMRTVSTRGSTEYYLTDEIGVTFTGEGKLQYLTGLCLFREGAKIDGIGLVSQKRMKMVPVNCAASFQ